LSSPQPLATNEQAASTAASVIRDRRTARILEPPRAAGPRFASDPGPDPMHYVCIPSTESASVF
jgi:hypothetical protein